MQETHGYGSKCDLLGRTPGLIGTPENIHHLTRNGERDDAHKTVPVCEDWDGLFFCAIDYFFLDTCYLCNYGPVTKNNNMPGLGDASNE